MRVISGRIRGKKLYSLEGDNTRPTTDRVKENIFNIIAPYVASAAVLDLFAGSGALGIEALSRGALRCDFVEISRDAAGVVKKNLGETPFGSQSRVFICDFADFLQKAEGGYDIIFLDPPYKAGCYAPALDLILKKQLLSEGGIIVMEADAAFGEKITSFEVVKERRYGQTKIMILKGE